MTDTTDDPTCPSTTAPTSRTPTGASSARWSRASSPTPRVGWCGTTTPTPSWQGECPDTAHPSLWRQGQLVSRQGLYEVCDGIYQVRGLDLSNMTLVEGDAGVIVIDPLISAETAAAALALYRTHRGDRPVTAVIYTHAHVDHFGGVRGRARRRRADPGARTASWSRRCPRTSTPASP